jgi:hypothetical protein
MSYSTYRTVTLATLSLCGAPAGAPAGGPAGSVTAAEPTLAEALQAAQQRIDALVERYRHGEVTPLATAQFEKELHELVRGFALGIVEWTYNHLEPAAVADLPLQVECAGDSYRRLGRKTPQTVDTLFGTIRVQRLGYRAAPSVGAPVLFPLCLELGVTHGTTPALCERVSRYLAETGATQQTVLKRLRQEHGVSMGVKRLRALTAFIACALEEHRGPAQAEQLVRWLAAAHASRGRHRPVLAVGRDGITLGLRGQRRSLYEVASAGTVTVYDRRGRRLGTVYLGYVPEPGQTTMTQQLTALLREALRRWSGPLPRLCYVTDAGDNETSYYKKTLHRLRHPVTGKRLVWQWVVDYYHVSERLTTLAEALFGKGQRAWSWMRKMQKLLLKPGGVGRVLHSAAALRQLRPMRGKRLENYQRAYRYLQTRRQYLRYAEYRRVGLPIGSGVTEAACKTLYTQRLKLSGMRWHKEGAQRILQLRCIWLSGVWSGVFDRMLQQQQRKIETRTPDQLRSGCAKKAA